MPARLYPAQWCCRLQEGRKVRYYLTCPKIAHLITHAYRYRYVDVAIASVMRCYVLLGILRIIASYDIACKFAIHFMARVLEGPVKLLPEEYRAVDTTWLVPKFHLGGHRPECSDQFSFNYTPGAGRMHGEAVETIWAELNHLKYSTREMGPGPRRETITAAMNDWNWKKIIKECKCLIDNCETKHNDILI